MKEKLKKFNSIIVSIILVLLLVVAVIFVYRMGFQGLLVKQNGTVGSENNAINNLDSSDSANLQEQVVPSQGIELPVKWGDLGKKMTDAGVIDKSKFEELYLQRDGLSEAGKKMIEAEGNGNIVINSQNSGLILNLLWALGLGNENKVLETGPMKDPKYGGAEGFASTGGWTLAKGDTMNHYSGHQFIVLTDEQQRLVEGVAKNVYRPCCGNSTYFLDCNHGMAMLGFLGLAASQGFGEDALYQMALVLNSYWFSDNYLTIAQYFKDGGLNWNEVGVKEVLGLNFSSVSGYQKILAQVRPKSSGSGGSCGV